MISYFRLWHLLERRGYSRKDITWLAGISDSTYRKLLNSDSVRMDVLERMRVLKYFTPFRITVPYSGIFFLLFAITIPLLPSFDFYPKYRLRIGQQKYDLTIANKQSAVYTTL